MVKVDTRETLELSSLCEEVKNLPNTLSDLLHKDISNNDLILDECKVCGIFLNNELAMEEHALSHHAVDNESSGAIINDGEPIKDSDEVNDVTVDLRFYNKFRSPVWSPVWEFAEKLDSGGKICKLCPYTMKPTYSNTSSILNHIKIKHRGTREEIKLRKLMENKKLRKIKKKSGIPVHLGNTFNGSDDKIENISKEVEDLETVNGVRIKHIRVKNSPVWEFAEKLDSGRIICKLCPYTIKPNSSNTSNILNHIKIKHRGTGEEIKLTKLTENKKLKKLKKKYDIPVKFRNSCDISDDKTGTESKEVEDLDTVDVDGDTLEINGFGGQNIRVKHSPVWEFAERTDVNSVTCRLCSHTMTVQAGNTSRVMSHILSKHKGTEAEVKLLKRKKNKKQKIKSETLKLIATENPTTLRTDMISRLGDQWQCKVCGRKDGNKTGLEGHIDGHLR